MSAKITYSAHTDFYNWHDGDEFDHYQLARERAESFGGCVTKITWEFSDSEPADDYRSDEVRQEQRDERDAG